MGTVYAAFRDRLLAYSTDDGDGTRIGLEGRDLECIAVSPAPADRVFVGTVGDGLFRTRGTDDLAFERLGTDLVGESVTSLAISPHDPDVVYAGTEPSRVYRSGDGGDSWRELSGLAALPSEEEWYFPPRPDTHHVRWLEVDPFDPDRLYVGIEAGAFVLTPDGGDSWHERPDGSRRDNHTLATHADSEGRVYTAAGDGYAESTDGGESWEAVHEGLEHSYCWGLAVDPADPDAVLVSSARGASSAHSIEAAESYVYRRRGDRPWERLEGTGLPTGEGVVRAVFETTGADGVVYAATNGGLFRTADFGDEWARLEGEWGPGLETRVPRGLAAVAP